MTIEELKLQMEANKIPSSVVNWASMPSREAYGISKWGDGTWEIYHDQSEVRNSIFILESEDEACQCLLRILKKLSQPRSSWGLQMIYE